MFLFFWVRRWIFENFIFWRHMKVFWATRGQWIWIFRLRKKLISWCWSEDFCASRDSNNYFHDMLCISNFIYKVSGNFSTHSCDRTTNILRHMPGKWSFIRFFQNDTLREHKIFHRLSQLSCNVKMNFHNFQIILSRFPISKRVTWWIC